MTLAAVDIDHARQRLQDRAGFATDWYCLACRWCYRQPPERGCSDCGGPVVRVIVGRPAAFYDRNMPATLPPAA